MLGSYVMFNWDFFFKFLVYVSQMFQTSFHLQLDFI